MCAHDGVVQLEHQRTNRKIRSTKKHTNVQRSHTSAASPNNCIAPQTQLELLTEGKATTKEKHQTGGPEDENNGEKYTAEDQHLMLDSGQPTLGLDGLHTTRVLRTKPATNSSGHQSRCRIGELLKDTRDKVINKGKLTATPSLQFPSSPTEEPGAIA